MRHRAILGGLAVAALVAPGAASAGPPSTSVFFRVEPVTVRQVRVDGLRARLGVGPTAPARLRVELLEPTKGRRLWAGTVRPAAPVYRVSRLHIIPPATVRRSLRHRHVYVVRVPAQAGLPVAQAILRVT